MNTDELESALFGAELRVLNIQTKLHRWARGDPHRRFDDLFNLVADPGFLLVAWDRARGNKGARTAGVDGRTASSIALGTGVEEFLGMLRSQIKDHSFRPLPVRERMIPKAAGKLRRLGIATITDRVVQASLKLVLEPRGVLRDLLLPAQPPVVRGLAMGAAEAPQDGLEEDLPPVPRAGILVGQREQGTVQPDLGRHHTLPLSGSSHPLSLADHGMRTATTRPLRGLWRAGCGAKSHARFGKRLRGNGPVERPEPRPGPTSPNFGATGHRTTRPNTGDTACL
ncbi:hypothetical protein ACWCXH_34255 [Kitasatospora sp. NPDC001660]